MENCVLVWVLLFFLFTFLSFFFSVYLFIFFSFYYPMYCQLHYRNAITGIQMHDRMWSWLPTIHSKSPFLTASCFMFTSYFAQGSNYCSRNLYLYRSYSEYYFSLVVALIAELPVAWQAALSGLNVLYRRSVTVLQDWITGAAYSIISRLFEIVRLISVM